jgi:voltage-gated potassium channel
MAGDPPQAFKRRRVDNARAERAERVERRFQIPMLVAAVLVVPMLVLVESPWGEPWDTVALVLNWGTWLAFVAELVVMLAVVPDRRRWLREHPVEVLVTLITPPVLPAGLAATRVLRLLKVVRLLRLVVPLQRFTSADGLKYAALLAFMTVLGGGIAFAAVESTPTSWDGVWWAASTMTTVGYGDIVPKTDLGRVIALVVMTVGIGFATLLIGAIAERFITVRQNRPAPAEVLEELQALRMQLDRIERSLAADTGPRSG